MSKLKWKNLKFVHWIYNLLHYRQLKHNAAAYKKYGITKPLFASLSSKDFPDKQSQAWLDLAPSAVVAPAHSVFQSFDPSVQEKIANWSDNGYIILENFFDPNQVNAINAEIDTLVESGKLGFVNNNKLMFANKLSARIKSVTKNENLTRLLAFILGKEVVPFQTINFIKGSQQRAHSDSIHMTTYPLGYLIAVWIALEDVDETNGPLFYYPGSHKLPFLLNRDYNQSSNLLALGKKTYTDYEDALEDFIAGRKMPKRIFLAKAGDLLIWHANLVHGGLPITRSNSTRKSMVIHYYASDVIKYHEITERPSLLKPD